jgi:hypothetical protein
MNKVSIFVLKALNKLYAKVFPDSQLTQNVFGRPNDF